MSIQDDIDLVKRDIGTYDMDMPGFYDAHERVMEYLESLRAPYRMTEKVPTVPGYYWTINREFPGIKKVATVFIWDEDAGTLAFTFGGASSLRFEKYLWSSSPFPLPIEGNSDA